MAMTSAQTIRVNAANTLPRHGSAGWLPVMILFIAVLAFGNALPGWEFMWMLALAIFAGVKWLSWWKARDGMAHRWWRSAAYLFAWPGMDAAAFLHAGERPMPPRLREWFAALAKTVLGGLLIWIVPRALPAHALLQGWVRMVGLILLLHFGSFHLAALLWQGLGVNAEPIMAAPLRSRSLSEFWGRRWNLGFRQLSYDLIFRPLQARVGALPAAFLVFVFSGLLHEVVISLPARGGYGLPTAYFVIQGLGVAFERSRLGKRLGCSHRIGGRLFTAVCTAGPLFLLFPPPFVLRVMVPFLKEVHAL